MADTKRDEAMRAVGNLLAAANLLEQIKVPHELKRVRDLLDSGQQLVNKAMLAMWEETDRIQQTQEGR